MTPRIATAAMFFVNGAVIGSWAAHIPFVRDQLDVSTGTIGLCLLAMAGGAVLAMPVAGQLLTRRSSAAMTVVAGAVEAVLLTLPLLAPSPITLALALLALGVGNGLLDVSMNAHGSALEKALRRPMMSSLHAGWSLGALAGAGVAAAGALAGVDPRLQMCVVAVGLLAIVAVSASRLGGGVVTRVERAAPAAAEPPAPAFAWPARPALLLGALAGAAMIAEGAIADWGALYLRGDLDAGSALAATGYAVFALGMTVGRLGGDAVNRAIGAAPLLQAGCALAAVALGGALIAGVPGAVVPALGLVGLGAANTVPVLFSAAGRIQGMAPGPAMAAVTTTGYAGLLAGPPVLGLLAQVTSLPVALGVAAALVGVVGLTGGRAVGVTTRGLETVARPCETGGRPDVSAPVRRVRGRGAS